MDNEDEEMVSKSGDIVFNNGVTLSDAGLSALAQDLEDIENG